MHIRYVVEFNFAKGVMHIRYVVEFNFGSIDHIGSTRQTKLNFLKNSPNYNKFQLRTRYRAHVLFDMFFFFYLVKYI
jgi:hypothetical protein